jgi:uncharacterized protein
MHQSDNNKPDVDGAIEYARRRMERELETGLTYHNLDHTFEEVLPMTLKLADLYHLDGNNVMLLAVAAAYHDIGWVIQSQEHETIGVEIARKVLPNYGFNTDQIECIGKLIMATRLPQNPTTLLEKILVDADMDSLGREDFWLRNEDLRVELALDGVLLTIEEWYWKQLEFLKSHTFFTAGARLLRREQKQKNIKELKRRLAQFSGEF